MTDQAELLANACKILYRLGLSDYLGHPSVRLGEHVLIKPKHSPSVRGMDTMRAADMVLIDLDGNLVEGEHEPPPRVIPPSELEALRRHLASPAGRWAYYLELA